MLRWSVGCLAVTVALSLGSCGSSDQAQHRPSTPGKGVSAPKPSEDTADQYARAVLNDDAAGARRWGARALSEAFPDESADGLRVDPHIFGPFPKDEPAVLGFDTSVLVRTSQVDQARTALQNCSTRFMTVSYRGEEYASVEEFEESLGDARLGIDDDVPSWVSDAKIRDGGVAIVFDSAWMLLPMMVTMVKIVRQELGDAGVTSAYITSAPQ